MLRIRFTKEGSTVWISHLDLMRLLQRAFRRAGLMLKHSQGYSPHPELSIVMPLSVGVSSQCELADFALEAANPPDGGSERSSGSAGMIAPYGAVPAAEDIAGLLNPVLPEGIRVLESYEGGQKAGKLAWLRARLTLSYEGTGIRHQTSDPPVGAGVPDGPHPAPTSHQSPATSDQGTVEALRELFARPSLTVEKHSKKGPVELDIAPMIREVTVGTGTACPPFSVVLEAVVAAQNPTLNPLLLVTAIETWLPEYKPDFVQCRRLEVYDAEMNVFR